MGLFEEFRKKAIIAGENAGKVVYATTKAGRKIGNKAVSGIVAVKQNVQDDIQHRHETKQIKKEGNRVLHDAQFRLALSQKQLEDEADLFAESLKHLEKTKPNVYMHFLRYLQRQFIDVEEQTTLHDTDDVTTLQVQREKNKFAKAAASGIASGVAAIGATTALGTASTGTALSALSGAAYLNALLAALGGGSVAAGGLGMIGGIAVLGTTIAAPVLGVLGYSADKKIKNDYQEVLRWRDELIKYCEQAHDACYKNDLQRQKLRKLNQDMSAFADMDFD